MCGLAGQPPQAAPAHAAACSTLPWNPPGAGQLCVTGPLAALAECAVACLKLLQAGTVGASGIYSSDSGMKTDWK